MPEIDDAALQTLQETFQEVADRANRLREWMELEPYLRSLETSFDLFNREVRLAAGPPPDIGQATVARLNDLWSRCQDTDFIDLQSFAQGVQYINQPLTLDGDNDPGPQLDISSLVHKAGLIQQTLVNVAINELRQRCTDFQRVLNGQVADRRNMVRREVRELCELTIRLKMKLEA